MKVDVVSYAASNLTKKSGQRFFGKANLRFQQRKLAHTNLHPTTHTVSHVYGLTHWVLALSFLCASLTGFNPLGAFNNLEAHEGDSYSAEGRPVQARPLKKIRKTEGRPSLLEMDGPSCPADIVPPPRELKLGSLAYLNHTNRAQGPPTLFT